MTLQELIDSVRAAIAERLTARAAITTEINGLRERASTGDATVTVDAVDERISARAALDAELDQQEARLRDLLAEQERDAAVERLQREIVPTGVRRPAYDEAARTGMEPRAYCPDNARQISFFGDAFAVSMGNARREARERIERNELEVRGDGTFEERATTTGSYAGLVVPQYLVDLAANVLRNGRPTANACTRLPIPEQGMSFLLPRATTGVTEASQATENAAVSLTDQVWANTTIPVASIAGQAQVSRQSLERGTPGIDQLIYADLAAAYAAELDRQIFVGTGASGQMTSINGQAGINIATLFGAAVTATTFYSKLAGQIAAIAGAGTAVRPSMIAMHPRRWGWLSLQVDTTGRPLVSPVGNGPYNAYGLNLSPGGYGQEGMDWTTGFDVVGAIQGLPIITDANVPTTLGGGSTEDAVFIFDQRHALLFEDGDGMPRQLRFEQIQVTGVTGFGATVTLAAYNYAAFTAGRYPQAFGRVGGADATGANGLQAPTY